MCNLLDKLHGCWTRMGQWILVVIWCLTCLSLRKVSFFSCVGHKFVAESFRHVNPFANRKMRMRRMGLAVFFDKRQPALRHSAILSESSVSSLLILSGMCVFLQIEKCACVGGVCVCGKQCLPVQISELLCTAGTILAPS